MFAHDMSGKHVTNFKSHGMYPVRQYFEFCFPRWLLLFPLCSCRVSPQRRVLYYEYVAALPCASACALFAHIPLFAFHQQPTH